MASPQTRVHCARLATAALALGCPAIETQVAIDVMLPADNTDLTRTNNVSLVLDPSGATQSIAAQGLDFALSLSLQPQQDPQTISLFMANDEDLLAWGRTAPVRLSGNLTGVSLLVTRPDVLSSFDQAFDAPDAAARAAPVADIGMLVLASDGTSVFLDVVGWQLRAAAAIPIEAVLDPADGTLVPDLGGGVQRVGANDALSIQRFDPLQNTWSPVAVSEEAQARFGQRPEATFVVTDGGQQLWILGGGTHRDVVSLDLDPDAAGALRDAGTPPLDAPRPGATAVVLARGAGETTSTVLFGADDDRPVAWWVERGEGLGPAGPWVGAACIHLEARQADGPPVDATLRVLCLGGVRGGAPTGDALVMSLPPPGADQAATVVAYPDLLAGAMADPVALPGATAVYAQGDGRAMTIAREGLAATASAHSPPRAGGGSLATLPLGITFMVGGSNAEGTPLSRWSTFAPAPG